MFKSGDVVTLKKGRLSRDYAIRRGDLATVTKEDGKIAYRGDIRLDFKNKHGQMSGQYPASDFVLVSGGGIRIELE